MIDVQSPLEYHLLQVSVAEWITEVPAYAEQNKLGLEVTPFEWSGGVHEIGSSHCSEYRRVYPILAFFATEPVSQEETAKRVTEKPYLDAIQYTRESLDRAMRSGKS